MSGIEIDPLIDQIIEEEAKKNSPFYIGFASLIRKAYTPHEPHVLSEETIRYIMHDIIVSASGKS